jgi:hypothetical protein
MHIRLLTIVAGLAGLLLLGALYIDLTGGWYTYRVLPTTICERFGRGMYDIWPEEPVPNQPNACLLRSRRFALP